jgi:hypothetical protein
VRTLLLDNNAHSYLFGRDGFDSAELHRVRTRLAAQVQSRETEVLLNVPLLAEMAGAFRTPHYRDMVPFAFAVARNRLLRPPPERSFAELVLRRRLLDGERYREGDEVVQMRAAMLDPLRADAIRRHAKKVKADERHDDTIAKTEVVKALEAKAEENGDPDWRSRLGAEFKNSDAVVEAWARKVMLDTAKENDLSMTEASLPDPRDTPTFWYGACRHLVHMDRVIVNDGSTTSKKQPNLFDLLHFDDCAYADVLVTEDERFRNLATKTGVGLVVVSFDEWARSMLVA